MILNGYSRNCFCQIGVSDHPTHFGPIDHSLSRLFFCSVPISRWKAVHQSWSKHFALHSQRGLTKRYPDAPACCFAHAATRLLLPLRRVVDRGEEALGLGRVLDREREGAAPALPVEDFRALDQVEVDQLLELRADIASRLTGH